MKLRNRMNNYTLRMKMVMAFFLTSFIIFIVNVFMYVNINTMVKELDKVYESNVELNDLNEALTNVQTSLTKYLNTKSSDSMEEYFRCEQEFTELVNNLNGKIYDESSMILEKNIKSMSESYLDLTNQAIQAKRGRNVEKYRKRYESASELYQYIVTYITSWNNEQFQANTDNYKLLSKSLYQFEAISNCLLVILILGNLMFIIGLIGNLTKPLKYLSKAANEVAEGNFDAELPKVQYNDEVGVVTKAFNTMVVSIKDYIEKLKISMETESALRENELKMEAHLKDAKLKYLQAQINPHFLFNTLNAGAQLAMMEGADRTYQYVQNVADFFRYNIKKTDDVVTLKEEIELIDCYIYILNVRFSGDIHFKKQMDESLLDVKVPGMILQPIVENSVNYGIRNIDWQGEISLSVYREQDNACISIKDNGIGMSQKKIEEILSGSLKKEELSGDSNGVGMDNVVNRLKLFSGKEDVIHIISPGENKGTETIIYLPFQKGEEGYV